MPYYPLFLDLSRHDVLVVGAGGVGRRKTASLLQAGARCVWLVDPALSQNDVESFEGKGPVRCFRRDFLPEDIDKKILVFAATNNPSANRTVTRLCREKGVLCNSADAPDNGDFLVPAHFCTGGISVALSTGGQSPALARLLREELEAHIGNRYSALLTVLGRLRPLLLEVGLSTPENSELFRLLARSPLSDYLERHDMDAAMALLERHLPVALHPRLGELLYGF